MLAWRDEGLSEGDAQMRAHLVARAASQVLEMRAVLVCFLTEPLGNQGRNPTGAGIELSSKIRMPSEGGPQEDRRYCIGRAQRLLVNLQIFQ